MQKTPRIPINFRARAQNDAKKNLKTLATDGQAADPAIKALSNRLNDTMSNEDSVAEQAAVDIVGATPFSPAEGKAAINMFSDASSRSGSSAADQPILKMLSMGAQMQQSASALQQFQQAPLSGLQQQALQNEELQQAQTLGNATRG